LVVSKLLSSYLPEYVDLGFTSEMEQKLDDIAQGDLDQINYLKSIYHGDTGLKVRVETQEEAIPNDESREINLEGLDGFSFRVGRYGAYVCRVDKETGEEVCASIPDENAPGEMTAEMADKIIDRKIAGHDALTQDPETGKPIYVLTGRYGPYVQRGDAAEEGEKPKRMALPPNLEPEDVDEEKALFLLSLPKDLGEHPDSGKPVRAGIGRFGPYIVHDGDFRSIPKTESVFDVTYARAMELLSQPKKGRGRAAPLKELGPHPETGDEMQVLTGKYGPYVKCGKTNVSLPESIKPEEATKEQVMELLEQKLASSKAGKKKTKKKKAPKKKKAKKKAKTVTKKAKSAKKKTAKKSKVAKKKTKKKSKTARKASE